MKIYLIRALSHYYRGGETCKQLQIEICDVDACRAMDRFEYAVQHSVNDPIQIEVLRAARGQWQQSQPEGIWKTWDAERVDLGVEYEKLGDLCRGHFTMYEIDLRDSPMQTEGVFAGVGA